MTPNVPEWVSRLCQIPNTIRSRGISINAAFQDADPRLDAPDFVGLVREYLRRNRGLIDEWQGFSGDNRGTPAPYLDRNRVGWFEVTNDRARSSDVKNHHNEVDACVDFIYRRANQVLRGSQVSWPPLGLPADRAEKSRKTVRKSSQ